MLICVHTPLEEGHRSCALSSLSTEKCALSGYRVQLGSDQSKNLNIIVTNLKYSLLKVITYFKQVGSCNS